jgi:hypothetical protein
MIKTLRARTWFITINKSANCFDKATETVANIGLRFYAIILHDKDTNIETGELVEPHYHALIEYEHARSFESIRTNFEGAHIEKAQNSRAVAQYLLHNTPQSKTKASYSIDEVTTNDKPRYEMISVEVEPFDANQIERYYNEGCTGILAFYRRFGEQIKSYQMLIINICRELTIEETIRPEE